MVCNEVVESGGTVVWEDIAGQDQAKRLIQELVVWPMKNPDLFKVCFEWLFLLMACSFKACTGLCSKWHIFPEHSLTCCQVYTSMLHA